MEGIRAKIDYILKHNMFINQSFKFAGSIAMKIWGKFVPVNDRAILFSGHSRKYNDSPRAIYEYMISHSEYQNYKFIWALEDPDDTEIPGKCIKVKADTSEYFKAALSSKYWITCVNIERSLKFKKRNQIYLNTWHGIPIKTVGNEATGRHDYDFSYIDYFCISSDWEIDLYKKSFNVSVQQVLKSGLPRNDALYNISLEETNLLKKKLGLPFDKKIILYAPTWRDSKDGGVSYSIKPPMDIVKWKEKLGEDFIILFRTHPYTNQLLGIEFNDFVRDYTNYPKINDLMQVADILISDYSATIFDYSVLERPIISFAYDCDGYARERGFTMNLRTEMPGGICETEDSVIDRIKTMDYKKECSYVKEFKTKYTTYGGTATQMCVKKIFG